MTIEDIKRLEHLVYVARMRQLVMSSINEGGQGYPAACRQSRFANRDLERAFKEIYAKLETK